MEKHSLYDCQRQFNCLIGSYNRHFAGKPRATRDLRLLEELIDQLRHLQQQVETLPDREMTFPTSQLRSHIKTQLGQFEEELIAITEAYQQATFAERFGYLGDRINQQFAIYREHFAGQPRLSRRPQLLQRAIANLQEIHAQLSDPVFDVLENQGDRATNIQLVAENLESLQRELEMIELEHEANSLSDRVASLGSAANAIIQEYNRDYAGKDRRNCDLIRLGWLCDLLTEIAQQMAEISSLVTSEANRKNWEIVQQCRLVYEQEYAQIEAAKTSA
ncbi:hypothetical protein [Planktothricoides raciborskii]|uniref:Uncharacterized protein n=1 Tax=Planktothricoides raciborskii FACHB-1370 TaxID=2949576 RepID=A0ABR8ECP3_9CYAN|nr:hypothetical protein [Planktothricoides raciborskii]MBD2544624.1 hypothetical protein [Planktothricoides raciborskii FACHB-1370]MBD2583569.1 hypothetical protein [Planktothricoides raciborskii FACHB-1261]